MSTHPARKMVHDCARRDKLELVFGADLSNRLPWSDWLWVCWWLGWIGVGIAIYQVAMLPRGPDETPSGEELAPTVLLTLVTCVCWVLSKFTRSGIEISRIKLARRGALVPAAIVQANNEWFDESNTEWLPASVIISFDPDASERTADLAGVAARVNSLKTEDRREMPADEARLAWDLYHEMGPAPRLPVPDSLCEGLREVWLLSVMLPPEPWEENGVLLGIANPKDLDPAGAAVLPQDAVD